MTTDGPRALKTPDEWMFHLRRAWNYEGVVARENEKMTKEDFLLYMSDCSGSEVYPPTSAWDRETLSEEPHNNASDCVGAGCDGKCGERSAP